MRERKTFEVISPDFDTMSAKLSLVISSVGDMPGYNIFVREDTDGGCWCYSGSIQVLRVRCYFCTCSQF